MYSVEFLYHLKQTLSGFGKICLPRKKWWHIQIYEMSLEKLEKIHIIIQYNLYCNHYNMTVIAANIVTFSMKDLPWQNWRKTKSKSKNCIFNLFFKSFCLFIMELFLLFFFVASLGGVCSFYTPKKGYRWQRRASALFWDTFLAIVLAWKTLLFLLCFCFILANCFETQKFFQMRVLDARINSFYIFKTIF